MQKLGLAALMTGVAIAVIGSSGSAAVAAEQIPTPSDATTAALSDRLQSFGIAADVQQTLIAKVLRGESLDADLGGTPASSTITTVDGVEKTRNVYADGSVAIGSVEVPADVPPAGGISTKSITGCHSTVDSFGTHIFSNCTVAWDAASWSVSWTADYDYNGNGEAITSAKSLHFGGVGDFSGAGTEIVTLRADRNGTAIADGYVNQKIGLGPVATTRRVGVRLQVATRWTDRKAKESPFST